MSINLHFFFFTFSPSFFFLSSSPHFTNFTKMSAFIESSSVAGADAINKKSVSSPSFIFSICYINNMTVKKLNPPSHLSFRPFFSISSRNNLSLLFLCLLLSYLVISFLQYIYFVFTLFVHQLLDSFCYLFQCVRSWSNSLCCLVSLADVISLVYSSSL